MIRQIAVSNKDLLVGAFDSNLKTKAVSGASALKVYSISKFGVNQVLLIEDPGQENSEVILTHGSTAPTGDTITLATNMVKDHPSNVRVYIIPFDKIEISWSATETGTPALIELIDIDPEKEDTIYTDSGHSYGYYFTRFKNSILTTYAGYSDAIPFDGFQTNTVGYAIETAMSDLDVVFSEKITFQKLLNHAKQMLRLVRGKLRSWSKYQEFGAVLGTLARGVNRFPLPDDIYDKNSNRSIMNVTIGDGTQLAYIDRSEYIQETEDLSMTTTASETAVGALSLVLTDSSDLSEEGSVSVYVANEVYTIEYTANDKYTNSLTIASDQVTTILPLGSVVAQDIYENTPTMYSVWDGNLYLYPFTDAVNVGKNVYIDYYTDIETIDSQADVIKGSKFDMLVPYLKWKIRAINENNGKEDLRDPSYLEFRELLTDEIRNGGSAEINGFRPRQFVASGGRKHNTRR
jgi:hypothetical protein